MRLGHRLRPPAAPRRRAGLRPTAESLEQKALLASVDLFAIFNPATAATDPAPLGVLETGLTSGLGAGFSSANVGDVNDDGFEDFVIGAPGLTNVSGVPGPSGAAGAAYLVFGSAQVGGPNIDWLTLNHQQQVGDLGLLGNSLQNNPVNGATGLAFDGLTITASQQGTGGLGAAVGGVGDVNGDGIPDFMIGAPGANDPSTGLPGSGRAYLIYGSTNLRTRSSKLLDLDNPSANTDLNIITFVNSLALSQTGRSFNNAGDVIAAGNGGNDLVIGAPGASLAGRSTNGAAYLIPGGTGSFLDPARTATVDLSLVGQGGTTGIPGVILAGANSGDQAGWSVASAGSFVGRSSSGLVPEDLVIGAPQSNAGPGQAYLVYGQLGNILLNQATVVNGVNLIDLGRILATDTTVVQGAIFTGAGNNDQTGYSVANAGDINGDGLGDFLVGSPFFDTTNRTDAGRVNLVFGRAATPNPPGQILGTVSLSSPGTNVQIVEFDGPSAAAFAGFATGAARDINGDGLPEILIGAPGFLGGQGIAYLLAGSADYAGAFDLAGAAGAPLNGTTITLSQPAGFNFLGASVGGRLGPPPRRAAGNTADGDALGDFVVGAPGFGLNASRSSAGAGFLLEGGKVPLATPASNAITSPIGVGGVVPPFTINATTPADLRIFILSAGSNTPGFNPATDIDPTTIRVNNVPLPDPTTFQQEPDQDGDGIPDASFVFSPRSLLGLTTTTTTITVTARTLTTSQFPNRRYTGSSAVTVVTGGGGGGGGFGSGATVPFGGAFLNGNAAVPPLGERFVPQRETLSKLRWKPLPYRAAFNQYLPKGYFRLRLTGALHKKALKDVPDGSSGKSEGYRTSTLGKGVFTRGLPKGLYTKPINHHQVTIPPTTPQRLNPPGTHVRSASIAQKANGRYIKPR